MKLGTALGPILVLALGATSSVGAVNPKWGSPLAMTPVSPQPGQTVTFRAAIVAEGGDVRAIRVVGGVDGNQLLTRTVPLVRNTQSQVVEFTWRATPGAHRAYLQIDPGRTSGDADARDNRVERAFTIRGASGPAGLTSSSMAAATAAPPKPKTPPVTTQESILPPQPRATVVALPDIVIRKIELGGGPMGALQPNAQYTVTVDVANAGQWETGDFLVDLVVRIHVPRPTIDQIRSLGSRRVTSIPPHKTKGPLGHASVAFPFRTLEHRPAHYTFTATVDSTRHIEEFDEDNNEAFSDLKVTGTDGP